jgi:hypothetical protein
MPKHETEVILDVAPDRAEQAAERTVSELGWAISDRSPRRMVAKERWKATGTTWPVTIETVIDDEGERSRVTMRGKVGGMGPVQSRHLRKQVARFADILGRAAELDPQQHAHQAASAAIAIAISRMKPKVRESLLTNLREDEIVRVVIAGSSGQVVAGTDSRVFVLKPGFVAGASFGVETVSWGHRQITGIQLHQGMKTGALIIQAPGQSGVSTSYWKESDSDPFKAPNAIPIAGDWTAIRRAVAILQDLIDHAQTPGQAQPASPTVNSASIASEITQLAALRAEGALTESEFAAAKARLIGG